jgi:hypothetical protein
MAPTPVPQALLDHARSTHCDAKSKIVESTHLCRDNVRLIDDKVFMRTVGDGSTPNREEEVHDVSYR